MVEMEIVYHLCLLVGFLLACFVFILIGALIAGAHCLSKSAMKELDQMIDRLDTMEEVEEGRLHEYKND